MKTISIIVVALVVVIGGYFMLRDSSSPPSTIQPVQNQIKGNEQMVMMNSAPFSFSPKEIRAKVGQSVIVHVAAQGQHTFTIDELGVNVETPNGRTTAVEFTPNQKGAFTFYCAIPGHRESGQIGTLTVE